MPEQQQCPLCLKTGLIYYLHSYQINLEEAVVLCENKLCPYPLAQGSAVAATFARRFEEISLGKNNNEETKIPDSQVALQTKVASHMQKFGHRLQKDAIGIQTGSPQLRKKLKSNSLPSRKPYKKRETSPFSHIQNGFKDFQQFHSSQNGSQSVSFQNFKSFSKKYQIVGATNGAAWNSCNGSEGSSDNASVDSLESNSSTSYSSSIGGEKYCVEKAKYPAFQFEERKTRSLPKSLPNLEKNSSQTLQLDSLSVKNVEERSDDVSPNIEKSNEVLTNSNNDCSFTELKSWRNVHEVENVHFITSCREEKDPKLKRQLHKIFSDTDERNGSSSQEKSCSLLRYPSVFPQWKNRDALCWLDVILCLTVHNETLKSLVFCDGFDRCNLIFKLLKAHNQACNLLHQSQGKCAEHCSSPNTVVDSHVNDTEDSRNQSINQAKQDSKNHIINQVKLNGVSKNIFPMDSGAVCTCLDEMACEDILDEVREEVWNKLKYKLRCERGQNESPVFALPLLLKEDKAVDELFRMNYWFEYKCSCCGNLEKTDYSNTLPTFPAVVKGFRICDPQHQKKCPNCGNTKDARTMVYKKLPRCLLMHFMDGLPDVSWAELQFGFQGYLYSVTGVVQYINNPDHFIAWLRNPDDNKWMKCDDLRSTKCRYRSSEPKFPSSQTHIVMWERLQTKPGICRQVAMEIDDDQTGKNTMQEKKSLDSCDTFPHNSDQDSIKVELKDRCDVKILEKTKKVIPSVINNHSVTSVESPGSTLSNESSDSVLLPNFISSTPDSTGVLRPIPKPVCSVPTFGLNTELHSISNLHTQETGVVGSYLDVSDKSAANDIKSELKKMNSGPVETLKVNSESGTLKEISKEKVRNDSSFSASQICGPKSLIKPSTVFYVPKKCNEHLDVSICNDNLASDKQTVKMRLDEPGNKISHVDSKLKNIKCELNERQKELDFAEGRVTVTAKDFKISKKVEQDGEKPEKANGSKGKEMIDMKEETSESVNEDKRSSSRLSSRFKVPFANVKRPSLSRDAFFTLEPSRSKAETSACSTPLSVSASSSPGLSGNLTFLNSVKQYLLSRTTGRTEQKFKFEGLNLKSSSNRSSASGLSELDLQVSSNLSSNCSDIPSVGTSACDNLDSESVSSSSSRATSSLPATCDLVTKLIEKLEQVPENCMQHPMTLKRKLESSSNQYCKKRLNDSSNDSDKMSSGNVSLKEISNNHRRKKLPGGKNMKLVKKLVRNAEKGKVGQIASGEFKDIKSKELQNKIVSGQETKCDTDSVLQDLYEALNIPFNSVNSTMLDILTDVDDILNFVSVGDVMPGLQRDDRSSSVDSFGDSKKHSDCWIRRPGRNSA